VLTLNFFNIFSNLENNVTSINEKTKNIFFEIRKAKKSDLFRPCWKEKEIKLKDFFREKKIPMHERDDVFVVVLKNDKFFNTFVFDIKDSFVNDENKDNTNKDIHKSFNNIENNNNNNKNFEAIAAVILNEKNIFVSKLFTDDSSFLINESNNDNNNNNSNNLLKNIYIRLRIKTE
jgi:tRNA(Ile)-lysidine synthetase-like protein